MNKRFHKRLFAALLFTATSSALAANADSGMADMNMAPDDSPSSAMDMGAMQGGSPPPDARDPHAYADGYDFGPLRPRFADEQNFFSLRMSRLEAVRVDDRTTDTYDLQAWFGRDYDRLFFKSEGDYADGTLEESSSELLWGHAVAPFWDTQLGVRYDTQEGVSDRTWLAIGIQGLAPYWFEVDATAYVGEGGNVAANLEVEYEMLFTQRLILTPRLETDLYGQRDAERGQGAGLATASFGLRLRYEFRREFAPYLGIEWASQYGETRRFTEAAGGDPRETRLLAGLRFWF